MQSKVCSCPAMYRKYPFSYQIDTVVTGCCAAEDPFINGEMHSVLMHPYRN